MPTKCGAKAKSTGKPCGRWALENGRCKYHGGVARSGPPHPNFKHGRHSKDLPTRILLRLEGMEADADLLNLSDEIRLNDARIGELVAALDTGETGRLWRELRASWHALQKANREKNFDAAAVLMAKIAKLITDGDSEWEVWRSLDRAF